MISALQPQKVFNTEHLASIGSFIGTHFPKDVAHTLRLADDTCNNTFLFDRPWDMERTLIPVTFTTSIDWEHIPAEDDEWLFMLARHGYASILGEAYSLTQNEKYPQHFVRLVNDFIDHAPLTTSSKRTTWRTIDSAIRVENWLKAYVHMQHSVHLTDAFKEKLVNSLLEHGDYLYRTHDSFRTISNWGVIQNQGLFLLGAFLFATPSGHDYMQKALERLEEHAGIQVMDDGTHWEQSPMYHTEVLLSFLNVILTARRVGIALPQLLVDKTLKMCHVVLHWAKPNHHQIAQGDSDHTDVRDILSRGAYAFNDSLLKSGGFDTLDAMSCWYEGLDAINAYQALEVDVPVSPHSLLSDSGNYYLRDAWYAKNFLHFHCGSIGSGHGHANLLHIDLFAHGEDILVDRGRYTYMHKPIRNDFKSAFSHNTTVVDNLSFTECTSSWGFGRVANYIQGTFVTKGPYTMVEGSHLGYMHLATGGVFTNRKVIYINPDIYIVIDHFAGQGTHTYDQLFHFNNSGQLTVDGINLTYTSSQVQATFKCLTPGVTLSKATSTFSPKYNDLQSNECAKYTLTSTGDTTLITVIHTTPTQAPDYFSCEKIPVTSLSKGTILGDDVAEALHIVANDQSYTILVTHKDLVGATDLVLADGLKGYGKIRCWDKDNQLTVLSW